MSSPDDPKPVGVRQRFWRELVARASKRMEEPGAADVEVDGDDESGSWDEPAADWMNTNKAAVRQAMNKSSAGPLDMVAAVRGREMLGALDVNRRGALDVRFWGVKVGVPFELFRLHDVPMRDAVPLNDFGSRSTRLRDGKQAWALARRYAESQPFKRVR